MRPAPVVVLMPTITISCETTGSCDDGVDGGEDGGEIVDVNGDCDSDAITAGGSLLV